MTAEKVLFSAAVNSPATLNTALGLFEAGVLSRWQTAFSFGDDSRLIRLLAAVGSDRLVAQLRRRQAEGLPSRLLRNHPSREIMRTLLARGRWLSSPALAALSRRGLNAFDRRVAACLGDADVVWAQRGAALETFKAAKSAGRRCVLSVGGLAPSQIALWEEAELAKRPDLQGEVALLAGEHQRGLAPQEWALADTVVLNSHANFASHQAAGFDMTKAVVLPLGFPPAATGPAGSGEPEMQVVWAGNFSLMKGATYLLDALASVPDLQLTLTGFGSLELPAQLLASEPRLRLVPTIPRAALMDAFRAADLLVLPSLTDGFGMVVSEAMSQGLPVLTTLRAGASQFIAHGENGLLVPAADAAALAAMLVWCAENRVELRRMGERALLTAAGWDWPSYRRMAARAAFGHAIDAPAQFPQTP